MNFLVIGPIVCDIAMKNIDPEDFKRGRTVLERFEIAGGGDANNAAIDLAALGEDARICARVGADFLGDRLVSLLEARGVDVRYLKRLEDRPTTTSVLMLGSSGDVTLNVMHHGANESMEPGDVTEDMIAWADHVHMVSVLNLHGFDGEGTARAFALAKKHGKTTSMDLKKRIADVPDRMGLIEKTLENCDVFLPSHYEVEYLCGLTDPQEAARYFRRFGLKVFGCKLGAQGAYLTDYKEEVFQPSLYRGTPVDVIGAGDAFSSTFSCAWKRGYSLKDAAAIASAASAQIVGTVGATAGMKDFDALVSFARACGALD